MGKIVLIEWRQLNSLKIKQTLSVSTPNQKIKKKKIQRDSCITDVNIKQRNHYKIFSSFEMKCPTTILLQFLTINKTKGESIKLFHLRGNHASP